MTQNKTPVIGVTGITGSGASTVAGFLEEMGGFVVSADKLAHEAMRKGMPAYEKIIAFFGGEVLLPDGEIDRRALGKIVFRENDKLELLEGIVHPVVKHGCKEMIGNCGKPFAVIDAPLLLESGLGVVCDQVWLVSALNCERFDRIMERDGLTREEAFSRLIVRQNEMDLREAADVIIYNSLGLDELKKQVKKRLDVIMRG